MEPHHTKRNRIFGAVACALYWIALGIGLIFASIEALPVFVRALIAPIPAPY